MIKPSKNDYGRGFVLLLSLSLAVSSVNGSDEFRKREKKWVAAWADAPDKTAGTPSSERTFREIVKPTVGSRGIVRLHFSNYFGNSPVTLGAVHVARQTRGAGVSDDTPVTFRGVDSITIPAHGFVTSDEVAFHFAYGDVLAALRLPHFAVSSIQAFSARDSRRDRAKKPNAFC